MMSVAVLNRVPRDKLPQVLGHILEKRAAPSGTAEVFSAEEMQQLIDMLQLSSDEIQRVVAVATTIFQQAAAFGDGVQASVLEHNGVEPDVVAIMEKVWRKKGRHVAHDLARAMPLEPTATLKSSQWQLQVELANRCLSNQSEPRAVFQLHVADEDKTEKVDLEMNHDELFVFFQQLNAVQKELDATATTGTP